MTPSDIKLISDALAHARKHFARTQGQKIGNADAAIEIAAALKASDSDFDYDAFLVAAGVREA
jgi:hypothetical protein